MGHSTGSSSSLLDGFVVPAWILTGLGSRESTACAGTLLDMERLLSASSAFDVNFVVSLTKTLSSLSFNLFCKS